MKTDKDDFKYALAISFAGEDRRLARYIAEGLAPEFNVFYDEFERAQLWGSDLSETLPQKYCSARFCVLLQSDEYLTKVWTVLERQAIIFEFLQRRGRDYVLPIRVRGCTAAIPGLSELIGYITIQSEDEWPTIIDLLRVRLRQA